MEILEILTDEDTEGDSYFIVYLAEKNFKEHKKRDSTNYLTPTGYFHVNIEDGQVKSYVRDYIEFYLDVIDDPLETPFEGLFDYENIDDGVSFKNEKLGVILKEVFTKRGYKSEKQKYLFVTM